MCLFDIALHQRKAMMKLRILELRQLSCLAAE